MTISAYMTKRNGILLAAILCIALLIRYCSQDSSDIEYLYGKVEKATIEKTVSITGRAELATALNIKSQISGVVTKVFVGQESVVKKGQLLAEIESPDAEFNYKINYQNYMRAKLDLESADNQLELNKKLLDAGLVAPNQFLEIERNYKKVKSIYDSSFITFQKTSVDYKNQKVYSSAAGIIFQVFAYPDLSVSKGTDLFQITNNLSELTLIISVNESDIGVVKKEQKVEFSVSAYPQKIFTGTITAINMTAIREGNVITYQAFVSCDNRERLLLPAMTVTGYVKIARKENVLSIPNEALYISPVQIDKKPNENIVWLKKGSGFKKITVDAGFSGDFRTEVKGTKLKAGDLVLTAIQKKKNKGAKLVE
jgi:HlyD family secretion protein